jgi:hypothetical protein
MIPGLAALIARSSAPRDNGRIPFVIYLTLSFPRRIIAAAAILILGSAVIAVAHPYTTQIKSGADSIGWVTFNTVFNTPSNYRVWHEWKDLLRHR